MTIDSTALDYWPADKPLPSVLTDRQLRLVLGPMSEGHFYRLKKQGKFRALETQLRVTSTTRYCGVLVARLRDHSWTHAQAFGGKRRVLKATDRFGHAAESAGGTR